MRKIIKKTDWQETFKNIEVGTIAEFAIEAADYTRVHNAMTALKRIGYELTKSVSGNIVKITMIKKPL